MNKKLQELLSELEELEKKHKIDSLGEAVDKLQNYRNTHDKNELTGLYRNVVTTNNYLSKGRSDLVHLTTRFLEEEFLS